MPILRDTNELNDEPLLLPAADAVQPEHACQWWYWSGQLRGEAGGRYGFQAAFFAAEALRGALWGQMAHAAIVDLERGRFASESRLWLGAPRRIEGRFDLGSRDGALVARGGDGRDRLELRVGELALDLRAVGGPTILHYDGRAHDYSFGGYTYYYSRPRMAGAGVVRRGGAAEAVRGEVWFDRQYGDLSAALFEGWQWLSVHLDDGGTIMVFSFNRAEGERFAAVVDAAGQARWVGAEGFSLAAIDGWRSPRSGVEYPCGWRLRIEGHDLVIRASTQAQEMNGPAWVGPVYWEGACEVAGSHRGVAYVELLGSMSAAVAEGSAPREDVPGDRRRGRALGRALGHPVAALGVATGVGWLAARVAALRPSFPEGQVVVGERRGEARVDGSLIRRLAERAGGRGSAGATEPGLGAFTMLRLARGGAGGRFGGAGRRASAG